MEMVHNPNSSNSDKYDNGDCCKEYKEYYYVTKHGCDCIKCCLLKVTARKLHIFTTSCIDCERKNRWKYLEKHMKSTEE
jgi:hypothetical protein